jgi:hypothetical protein
MTFWVHFLALSSAQFYFHITLTNYTLALGFNTLFMGPQMSDAIRQAHFSMVSAAGLQYLALSITRLLGIASAYNS